MADGDPGNLVLDVVRENGARRVARVVEQQGLGPRRDGSFDLGRIEREVFVDRRVDAHRHAAGEDDARSVGHVRRLVDDDLVARVQCRAAGHVQRLRGADGDQDLLGGVVPDAVQPLQVMGEGATQFDRAVVAGVVRSSSGQRMASRLDDLLRGVEVRLPHPEADDVGHRGHDVEEAADA